MAFVKVETTAFLVREKGFDAESFGIPVAGFFDQFQVGNQVDRLLIAFSPPGDGMNGAVTMASKQHFG